MNSKWNPFNAVASGNDMVNEVLNEKYDISMPILSDDQKQYIQKRILEAFNAQDIITITYFKQGKVCKIKGIVTKIDAIYGKISLNNDFYVFFSQIIEISQKNACIPQKYMLLWICSWGISSVG